MKLIKKDFQKDYFKLQVENNDDLWHLSHIIDAGDYISGTTFRKIKIGDSETRNAKVVKKKVRLKISVEKIEFHKYSDILRVSGKIAEGPEDMPLGSYHTFNIEAGVDFTLEKQQLYDYQLEKLKEATKPKKQGVLLCVFDRESAIFALMKTYGYDVLSEIKGDVAKKDNPESVQSNFYKEIINNIEDYVKKHNINKVVVGSPAFWKEYLLKQIDSELKSKIITASCNNVGKNGINELLKRPEVISALKEDRIVTETNAVEQLFKEIKSQGSAAYGFQEVKNAADAGAIKELLVSDELIQKKRQQDSYAELDNLMKTASSSKARVHVISSEHEAGQKLDGLGGIGAILRFII
ncbi:MAG: mRNA surveillance protein pelota [Nanoarchaeota archaeon]